MILSIKLCLKDLHDSDCWAISSYFFIKNFNKVMVYFLYWPYSPNIWAWVKIRKNNIIKKKMFLGLGCVTYLFGA